MAVLQTSIVAWGGPTTQRGPSAEHGQLRRAKALLDTYGDIFCAKLAPDYHRSPRRSGLKLLGCCEYQEEFL